MNDHDYMRRALALAEQATAQTSPNPLVGCVIVRDEKIIGEGTHLYANKHHAEVVALQQAGSQAKGATAYVTLEPCNHQGRTPPCTEALIQAGIKKVVIATPDPNPLVCRKGIARLREAGIQVTTGVSKKEARTLNNAFAKFIRTGLPFVTLKAAVSIDSKISPPLTERAEQKPFWLTSPASREDVQQLRHQHDAILTGIGTVLADNPHLTDRTDLPRRRPLLRVVLDSHLRIPLDSNLITTAQDDLLILHAPTAAPEKIEALADRNIQTAPTAHNLQAVLKLLAEKQITSVIIEAGSQLNQSAIESGLIDQFVFYYANTELGPEALPFSTGGQTPYLLEQSLTNPTRTEIGPDTKITGLTRNPWL